MVATWNRLAIGPRLIWISPPIDPSPLPGTQAGRLIRPRVHTYQVENGANRLFKPAQIVFLENRVGIAVGRPDRDALHRRCDALN